MFVKRNSKGDLMKLIRYIRIRRILVFIKCSIWCCQLLGINLFVSNHVDHFFDNVSGWHQVGQFHVTHVSY